MRKRAIKVLCAMVLGYLGVPAWAEGPPAANAQPLPDPTPLGAPSEASPLPGGNVIPNINTAQPLINGLVDGNGCTTGGNNCCCERRGYWTVGGGVYYIQPVFESNPAFLTTRSTTTGSTVSQKDFSHGMDVAPLGFVGYTGAGGFGIRARWFQFDGNGSVSTSVADTTKVSIPGGAGFGSATLAGGSVVEGNSNLRVDVWDLEATYVFHCGGWSLLTSAGARYAHMSQDYAVSILDGSTGSTIALAASHNFNGGGPTFSIQGQRQICDSCFSLYGSARGSILFGSAHQVASFASAVEGVSQQTDVLPIGEIEVGGQWGKVRGHYRLFAQLGFVGQAWFGGGNAAQGLTTIVGGTSDNGTNFGFFGGVARAGINF